MRLSLLIGAALLAASTTLFAQVDRQQIRDARAKALKACEGKAGDERRACMRRETCAQAKDPAQCEARINEAAARRAKIREACEDRQGEERRACIREHRGKT